MRKFFEESYKHFKQTLQLIYLNLLWIIFIILGLGVFGFIPSTIAMYTVIRKWVFEEEDFSIWGVFWSTYKANFFKHALLGVGVLLIGYLLLIELNIFWSKDSLFYFAISIPVIATFIIYLIGLIYFFPVYVHFENTLREYLKMSFTMGIIYPFMTVGMLLLVILLYIIFWSLPLVFILFGGSVTASIIMRASYEKFARRSIK